MKIKNENFYEFHLIGGTVIDRIDHQFSISLILQLNMNKKALLNSVINPVIFWKLSYWEQVCFNYEDFRSTKIDSAVAPTWMKSFL